MYPPIPNMWGQGSVPAAPSAPPQQQNVDPGPPNFFEHYQQNYGHLGELPNHMYDAVREKFFGEHVGPWAMQKGEAVGPLHTQFMKQTEREGTSENPRMAVVGKAALSSLLAPLKIVGGDLEIASIEADKAKDAATLEASRNGINPFWYEMLGEAGGQMPYWMAGMGVMEAGIAPAISATTGKVIIPSLLEGSAKKALEVATGALIQGTYDAAKAPDGQRFAQGFQGAVMGGGMTLGVQSAKSLWHALKTGGLTDEAAKAVEKTAQGFASPEERTLAARAVVDNPGVESKIGEWTQAQASGVKAAGIPSDTLVGSPDKGVRISVIGSDGKSYAQMPVEQVPMDNLVSHLKAGGQIQALEGDPVEIQGFLSKVERAARDAFKLEGVNGELVANDTIISGPRNADTGGYEKLWQDFEPTHPMKETEYTDLWKGMDQTRQEVEGMELLGQPVQFGETSSSLRTPSRRPMDTGAEVNPDLAHRLGGNAEVVVPPSSLVSKMEKVIAKINSGDSKLSTQYGVEPGQGEFVLSKGRPLNAAGLAGENWESFMVPGHLNTLGSMNYLPEEFIPGMREGMMGESLEGIRGLSQVFRPGGRALREAARISPEYVEAVERFAPLDPGIDDAFGYMMDTTLGEALKEYGSVDKIVFALRSKGAEIVEGAPFTDYQLGGRGRVKFRAVEMEDVPPSERPLNWEYKQKPLYERGELDEGMTGAAAIDTPPGEYPWVKFSHNMRPSQARDSVHHEMIHAHMNYLDMHGVLKDAAGSEIPTQVMMDFPTAVRATAYADKGNWAEEVFSYTSAAIRTGNKDRIEWFSQADGGKQHFLNWYTETANALREHASTLPDSLHKRTLERRLNYTVAQASKQLEDIRRPFSQTHGVGYESSTGLYYADDLKTGVRQWAPNRESLIKSMEEHQEPLNTPELVDYSNLPPVPRYAVDLDAHTVARAPITSDPPHLRQTEPNLGPLALSNFFRPFYDWVGSVGKKMGRPDLTQAFEAIRDAQTTKFNTMRPMMQTLDETLYKYPHSRQTDFYKYYEAATPEAKATVAQAASFSKEELFALRRFEAEFDSLPGFREYINKILPEMRDQGWDVETRFPKSLDSNEDNSAMIGRLMRRGQLDPRDQNLLRVASTYLNGHTFHEVVEPLIKNAEKIVDEQTVAGGYEFDILRPMLRRQIQYYRGVPDWSQKVVMSAVDTAVQNINKGITAVNKGLPGGMQIPAMKDGPRDILGKFIMFNYAGALALRPAVPIRDTLSLFMTAYPLLGEEYLWKGMRKAMTFMGEGKTGDAFQVAEQNGWLMNKTTLPEMIAAGGERQSGTVSKWTEKAMSVMTLSENSKRLAAGWGFAEKIGDAVKAFAEHGDKDKFIKESGLWFLGPARRDLRVSEAARLTAAGSREGIEGWSLKAAKDMVDATNWDFSSGAAPGIYKYQLGRLFGQYGQWPMNYIEYARKFATHMTSSGQREEAIKGMSRFVIAHGAVLAAAQSVGIDAAQWTFTQPMAYGGGPLFNAVVNIPNTMDFETYQGTQARREVIHPVWPGVVPGSNAVRGIWKAIAEDKDDVWIRILGFQPTKETQE